MGESDRDRNNSINWEVNEPFCALSCNLVIREIVQYSYTLFLALSESGTDWQSGQLKPCEVTSKSTGEKGREEQARESQKERENVCV